MTAITHSLQNAPVILTEGAVIERLRRDPAVRLDPDIMNAGFIYGEPGQSALTRLYREYLDIGRAAGLPLLLGTPTWRAHPERLARAGYASCDVNGDAVRFVQGIRAGYGAYAAQVFIGGLLGCQGDAYAPSGGLTAAAACRWVYPQVQAMATANVDFLWAVGLPQAEEALGIAQALAACALPAVLSFIIRADGALLDGTPLQAVVARIDTAVTPRPVAYFINCVHPTTFAAAMAIAGQDAPHLRERVIGLQANASALPPEELDGRGQLAADPPDVLADAMLDVHGRWGVRVLGGCCGTDGRHIAAMAARVHQTSPTEP